MTKAIITIKGGTGSGHYDHAGLAGMHGGSLPSGGSSAKKPSKKKPSAKKPFINKNMHNAMIDFYYDDMQGEKNEVGYILDSNGNKVSDKITSGDPRRIAFTGKQEAAAKGNVLIHNHPLGGGLSEGDIKFGAMTGAKAIIALDTRGVHIMNFLEEVDMIEYMDVAFYVNKVSTDIRKELTAKIESARMLSYDANLIHNDMLWERVESKFPNYFEYTFMTGKELLK